jgi:RND family efflux transporter MFP subunit
MPEPSPPRTKRNVLIAALLALAVVGFGVAGRARDERSLAAWTAEQALPSVAIIHPSAAPAGGELTLPASLEALNSTSIYARTSGYVRRWLVDIGDTVKHGQLLVELDAPELEQQLAVARADLQTALVNEKLASSTAARWKNMLAQGLVSTQEEDEKVSDLAAKSAVAEAARANVARLESLIGFTRLTAPFDGVVTSRSAQIGTLVTAGSAGAAPLFTVADVSRMRAFVRVPQIHATQLRTGMAVTLSLPEYPGRAFAAKLTRTAGAIDPASGALLVELQAANPDRALKPGAYARAGFPLQSSGHAFTLLPPSALILGEQGTRVALYGAGGTVELRTITLGRDLGNVVEVISGLAASDAVIDNPPDSLEAGDRVLVASGEKRAEADR